MNYASDQSENMKNEKTTRILDVFEPENATKPTNPNWQKYFVGIMEMESLRKCDCDGWFTYDEFIAMSIWI